MCRGALLVVMLIWGSIYAAGDWDADKNRKAAGMNNFADIGAPD